ncbi:MAG: FtsX-like permease family protein, partial [Candidatus Hodarchaeales archaeon]
GIQITTATLENGFLTSLLLREGEVDITIFNATGGYLTAADESNISALLSEEALGIMPELTARGPAMIGSQFDPSISMAGIPFDYPAIFGEFYDWMTDEKINISDYLVNNISILLSSRLADDLGLNETTEFPVTLNTEFSNVSIIPKRNMTTGEIIFNSTTMQPEVVPVYTIERVNLSVMGVYDSKRPGIGAAYGGALFSLEAFQQWQSLQDPTGNQDLVSAYLISYKGNHFEVPIDEDYLQEQYDLLEEALPVKMVNGEPTDIYAVSSARLIYFTIINAIFGMLSAFLNVLGLLIIITGILLITNVQLMSVEDREFQTGVLRAVGEKRRGIFQTMLFETLFQGVFGGIFGLIGGLVFGQVVALYLVSLFGSGSASVQPVVNENVAIFSVIVGVILGMLTGFLPALRASRVNIVEALRGIKVAFEEKSSRNLVFVGILMSFLGTLFLLNGGLVNKDLQYIWLTTGWDSVEEWQNILLGAGFLFTGLGFILSRFINRIYAFNLTAIVLWATPVFMFVIAMGDGWITDMSSALDILIFSIIEIVIGSVMIVGMNLTQIMRFLRGSMIRINGIKGVAQVAPALISSHKTRSTLTFAIFAVVLTLNVTVASLVATNVDSTVGQSEEDSRGIDLYVTLSKPEAKNLSYIDEIYNIDSSISDVIGMKTFSPSSDYTKWITTVDPYSPDFDPQSNLLPLSYGELRSEQIRGDAISASDDGWRFDFYLENLPDGIRPPSFDLGASDKDLLDLSKRAYDAFFDPSYKMTAYNVSFDVENIDISQISGFGRVDLKEEDKIIINGTEVKYPIVFSDSFLMPLGMPLWVPMNSSGPYGLPFYQPFVIGGTFDRERAGGFPLAPTFLADTFSGSGFTNTLGSIYYPERFSKFSNFFGEADGVTPLSRAQDQFDTFFIKTTYPLDHPYIETIAQEIEDFTNSDEPGFYRDIINDNFIVATATTLYSKLEISLEMMEQMTNFLQIYVNFGLIIGSVGMAVISVRNVAERKREIGMMRAIGFPRLQVMLAALLELLVLGFIGLLIGVVNGLFVNVGFANMLEVPVVIPWGTIVTYLSFITFIGMLAGAIPGWFASRIPAAEALRYVG